MTLEQALIAAREIDAKYLAPGCVIAQRHDSGLPVWHLRWMVEQMHADMSPAKAMRWLGYIQGVLVAQGRATLDEMKQVSTRAVGK